MPLRFSNPQRASGEHRSGPQRKSPKSKRDVGTTGIQLPTWIMRNKCNQALIFIFVTLNFLSLKGCKSQELQKREDRQGPCGVNASI
jgi:hypothetical protein